MKYSMCSIIIFNNSYFLRLKEDIVMRTIIINIIIIASIVMYAVPVCAQDISEGTTQIEIVSSVDIDSMTNDEEEKSKLRLLYRNLDKYKNPKWSPDGKWIGFEAGFGMWIVPVEGGEPIPVYNVLGKIETDETGAINGGEMGCVYFSGFSPDSRKITFVIHIFDSDRGSKIETVERNGYVMTPLYGAVPIIVSVDMKTGERRTIVEEARNGRWSSSGKYFTYMKINLEGSIEYQRYMDAVINEGIGDPETSRQMWDNMNDGVYVLDMETGEKWLVAENGWEPCFTPDDNYVIFSHDDAADINQIFRVPIMGGEIEQLTFYAEDEDGHNAWNPEVSPDGQWILHSGQFGTDVSPHAGLYLFHVATRETFPLYPDYEYRISEGSWSPDGTQFLFTTIKFPEMTREGLFVYSTTFKPGDYLNLTGVETGLPVEFAIDGNYPNPFNPATTIEFSLPQAGFANLFVYNVTGQKIRELVSGHLNHGVHFVVWDGRDEHGLPVSAGVYVTRLRMGNVVTTGRMMLVK